MLLFSMDGPRMQWVTAGTRSMPTQDEPRRKNRTREIKPLSAGTDYERQNLTSIDDPRAERNKNNYDGRRRRKS